MTGDLSAVHIGKLHVGQEDVGRRTGRQRAEGVHAVQYGRDLVTLSLKQPGQTPAGRLVVLDQKDSTPAIVSNGGLVNH